MHVCYFWKKKLRKLKDFFSYLKKNKNRKKGHVDMLLHHGFYGATNQQMLQKFFCNFRLFLNNILGTFAMQF